MKNDILNNLSDELREMPYSVPEGYFDGLRESLLATGNSYKERSFAGKIMPYVSMAAAFLLLVTAGTFILERTTSSDDMTYEDYMVYSDMMIEHEYDDEELHVLANEVEAEDIVEYLIYTGVTAEAIELSK